MRGIDPRTSRMRSKRSTIWATSPYPLSFELSSEQNPCYISFRFVTNCQFLPVISKHHIQLSKPQKVLEMRGTDPRTSRMQSKRSTIWATSPYPSSFELASEQNPWYISFRFETSCQFLPIISKHQIELSKLQKVLAMRGIDPRTSRMRSKRSTIWATSPYPLSFELSSEQNPCYISFRFVTNCQFLPVISKHHIQFSKPQNVLEMRGTDPRTSRMQSKRSIVWATSPYPSSIELASEQNPWYISFRFVTSCQFLPIISKHQIELSKPQSFEDAGHRSTHLSHAKRALCHFCYVPVLVKLRASFWTKFMIDQLSICNELSIPSHYQKTPHRIVEASKSFGDAGHRSPYLSHANQALYRLSYIPVPFKLWAFFWTKSMLYQLSICNELSIPFRYQQTPHTIVEASKSFGDAGHRSTHLSHAKQALYHLSYIPVPFKLGASFWTKSMLYQLSICNELSIPSHYQQTPNRIVEASKFWRCGAPIHAPLACKASALPFLLRSRTRQASS